MKLQHIPGVILSIVVLFGAAQWAQAKTIRVEPWGGLAPNCGSKAIPCVSIQSALLIASKNDRIIVGPGEYSGNYQLNFEGLRLESSAGPHVTVLRSSSASSPVFSVNQRRVQIGRRGRGFTVMNVITGAGIAVTSVAYDGTRVEGNVLKNNDVGILLRGDKVSARHNLVLDSGSKSIHLIGVDGGQVSDNRIYQQEGRGIEAVNSEGVIVRDNLVSGAQGAIVFTGGSLGNKVQSNAMIFGQGTVNNGVSVTDGQGTQLVGNVVSNVSGSGAIVSASTPQVSPVSLKNNAVVATGSWGYALSGSPSLQVRFEGNDAIATGDNGVRVFSSTNIQGMRGNNLYDNGGIGISNTSGIPVLHQKTYLGLVNGVPSVVYSTVSGAEDQASTEATRPNPFRAKKAARLM